MCSLNNNIDFLFAKWSSFEPDRRTRVRDRVRMPNDANSWRRWFRVDIVIPPTSSRTSRTADKNPVRFWKKGEKNRIRFVGNQIRVCFCQYKRSFKPCPEIIKEQKIKIISGKSERSTSHINKRQKFKPIRIFFWLPIKFLTKPPD